MTMDKTQILNELIRYYADGNATKFAKMLGVEQATISTWRKRNTFNVDLIIAKCNNVSTDFVLKGEGEIEVDDGTTETAKEVAEGYSNKQPQRL